MLFQKEWDTLQSAKTMIYYNPILYTIGIPWQRGLVEYRLAYFY